MEEPRDVGQDEQNGDEEAVEYPAEDERQEIAEQRERAGDGDEPGSSGSE